MPAAVPSMSIAPLIVTSTTGTTIQTLDYLTGETSVMSTTMMSTANQSDKEKAKKHKRHWWSRFRKSDGRPCREMQTLETTAAHRSRSSSRSPRPLDESMFPRRISNNSSQSVPTPPVNITATPASPSSVASSISSCSNSSIFGSETSRTTTGGGRSSTSSIYPSRVSPSASTKGAAGVNESLGTKAIMKEQTKKSQGYRERRSLMGDPALDALMLSSAFVIF
ncbi:hypothetical protein AYL99_05002 [Fonsecaea erecta]|uniref:Uncharacterized protein n=1 Tax=Fonsecaea erecta TaxID=1367422 RepID=A0A178ZJM8_9EURO|nr:hypothetical protein AYL99_05002 [Fonsecaea erecta]OAP60000.1 hypothetical protein AYL99_05002 [Fonsecaea erecta]